VDVLGAFMQVDVDDLVHVRFTGVTVDRLLDIDYAIKEKVINVELLKALYGTLQAARLFWVKLSVKLHE
jgi:hypothetical protein